MVILVTGGVSAAEPQPVVREHFVYYFDSPRFVPIADSVLTHTRARLAELVGEVAAEPAEVHIVGAEEEFTRLVGGKFPEWGAGAAIPARNLIVIKSPDKFSVNRSLDGLLAHEYTHLYLAWRAGYNEIPRWFNEGMAQLVSMEWSWLDNLAMEKAGAFGDFVPLSEIDRVNGFYRLQAEVAYGESYLAVNYLYKTYGAGAPERFMQAFASGGTVDEALYAATGATMAEFETDFDEYLESQYNLLTLFADTVYLWIGLALVVVVAGLLRWRKRRSYYRKWEEEERVQSTDFDYGDQDEPEIPDDDEPWRR